jgi:hypothetical protein
MRPSANTLARTLRLLAIVYFIASWAVIIGGIFMTTSFGEPKILLGLNYIVLICREFLIVLVAFGLAHLLESK